MSNYIDIDFTKIKGYNKLGSNARKLFENTYKKHNGGTEEKEKWLPTKVCMGSNCLKVTFVNGEWLHYHSFEDLIDKIVELEEQIEELEEKVQGSELEIETLEEKIEELESEIETFEEE
ncbi:MAG: hypothetical protein N4A63_13475 [Vallitalea sp.]|nr:hypothetical protein [Vallitalea sp.]